MIPEINLLPQKDRGSQRATLIFFVAILIWLILAGIIIFHYFQTKSDIEFLQSRTDTLTTQKAGLEKQKVESSSDVGYPEAVSYVEKLTVPTAKIIQELIDFLPKNQSYLSNYSYEGSNVKVQTQFESLDLVANYVAKLNSSELFTDVKVDTVSTFSLEENEDESDEAKFAEMPRYDVSITVTVNLPALLSTGGEADE